MSSVQPTLLAMASAKTLTDTTARLLSRNAGCRMLRFLKRAGFDFVLSFSLV
jgi:hypothetical protein